MTWQEDRETDVLNIVDCYVNHNLIKSFYEMMIMIIMLYGKSICEQINGYDLLNVCANPNSESRNVQRARIKKQILAFNARYNCDFFPFKKMTRSERMKLYLKTHPNARIAYNHRSVISTAIRKSGGKKNKHTEELLGCSIEELKKHLESKFQEGMTWDNYGEWHIDHIKPCASFDLTNEEQQKECFNYKNLQPLWAKENLSKSSWYEGEKYFHKK